MFKLFRYLKNYKKESFIGPLFKLIEACFELAVPVVMKRIIDIGIKNEDVPYILRMGAIMVLLGFLGLACSLTAQYFAAKASVGFGTALRTDLLRHINRLSYSEIDKVGSSTLVTRMTADINTAQSGVNILLRLLLRSPFIVVGAVIMAFAISVKLTLIFLVIAPCLAFVIYKIMSITIPRYKNIQKTLDRTNLLTGEALSGARVIRAFSAQKSEENEFEKLTDELADLQIKAGRINALMNPMTYVIVNLGIAVLLKASAHQVYNDVITQGDVIALVNYMNQILLALLAMAILVTNITKMQASAIRINDIFDIGPTVSDEGNTDVTADTSAPAVEFRGVSFSYHDSEEYALEDISFTVNRGETVGIIGGTGSGKSSVVNLIPRFYDASKGQVLIDGVDVKEYPFAQLRGKIGIVPQRAVLFKGTVRDNMKWRDSSADDEEIISALKLAQAYDFVMEKPDKLDEMIMQEGKNLSGGQRQRLTIARAFVGAPEIVMLDDSASALDLATEARLRKALSDKTGDMTVFIVSQRISSIKNVDKIIVLDDGKIAGIGTHKELCNSCDVYREICLSQLSEEEVKEIG
ncbi:ABC transporter ATP-binding protein [Ruminococcus sp.]|uniref:ABC transporter ATP-binding protein n=1 Tax=Ruminococcus sp. TaxID=41978 RepID=UPI00258F3B7B|nr:ABC transporter ATP-binding protein [Ruminococcus sp.]MCR5022514.1 ABC transporter ATP-binding protein/permease [Ruminococcus sp.]